MTVVVQATGSNVTHAVAAARKLLGIKLSNSREVLRSGGEDSCHRVHLTDGTIVEVQVIKRSIAQAWL